MTEKENSSIPLLDVRDLSVVFDTDEGTVTAVDGASFAIDRDRIVGLVGESGCGKSVTAQSILRLVPSPPGRIRSGQILYHGDDLLEMPIKQLRNIRGKKIGMVFQEPLTALSPLHRVGKQLTEALRLHFDIDKDEARNRARQWLDKVGIPDSAERMYSYPFELSGGMRQRVMIAMALILGPDLLVADEPTTALDVTVQAQIMDLMRETRPPGASILFITHDMGVIWEMCDRVIVMYASRIVEEGTAREVFEDPQHPYTWGLLKAMPSLSEETGRLPAIKGSVPSLLNLPKGCLFAERCPDVQDRCRRESPELLKDRNGRRCACFFSDLARD